MLDLFHPDGCVGTSLVIGSNCPAIFLPESQMESGEDAALVILAPTVEECRKDGWLEKAAQLFARRLAKDGVGYVIIFVHWRFKIAKLLHNSGLSIDSAVGHLPDWASSHYMIPFSRNPIRYAFSALIPTSTLKRSLIRSWFLFPGAGQILGYIWPSAGLIVRRPGARPLFEWLFKTDGDQYQPGCALIRTSWRGKFGATLLYRFSNSGSQPSAIAKITLAANCMENQAHEAIALTHLGPGARSAGAQVPQLLIQERVGRRSVLQQTVVTGQSADDLLRAQPEQLFSIVNRIVGWLERWNHATMVVRPLDVEQLDQEILKPATLLTLQLERGEEYRNWLDVRCRSALGVPMPFVAAHNDLTMVNVLFDEHRRLGVVDWEESRAESWPLGDYFYALTDAVLAASGHTDRLKSFKDCFVPGSCFTSFVTRFQARLVSVMEISADLVELCFHACWLHHAANEYQKSSPGDSRPFLRIVQWLAVNSPIA